MQFKSKAPQVKAKGFGVSLEGNWTGGGLEAGLLLAATAVQSSVKEVSDWHAWFLRKGTLSVLREL
jgi:hypothetical protein